MNSSQNVARSSPRNRFRWGHWLLIVMAALTVVVAVEVAGVFTLVKEASQLRETVVNSTQLPLQTQVQFTVGPAILGLGRTAVSWIDEVPREGRQALAAMRRASVGVYEFDQVPTADQRVEWWTLIADHGGLAGWDRIVSVNEGDQSVMIFMPSDAETGEQLEVCLVVCEGRQLIIVSAVADSAPLLELAQEKMGGWTASITRI